VAFLCVLNRLIHKGGMPTCRSYADTHGANKKAQKSKTIQSYPFALFEQMNFSVTFIFCILYRPK